MSPPEEIDNRAIDLFAEAMKIKMAKSRKKGRGGWNDASCNESYLASSLIHHLGKGNDGTFEDVAIFAMMLHQRNADPSVLATEYDKITAYESGFHAAIELAKVYYDNQIRHWESVGNETLRKEYQEDIDRLDVLWEDHILHGVEPE